LENYNSDTETKISPLINLTDESFDNKKSNTYHLSILIDNNSFSFCVLDTNTNKYLVLKETPYIKNVEDIITPFKECGIASFRSVTCAITHNKFTLVPSALFDEENKKSFIEFSHPISNEEEVFSNTLHSHDAKNIFTVSKDLVSAIKKYFTNAYFIHSSTSFIEGLLVQNKNNPAKKVFADFHSSCFEIVVLENGKLLLSNAFTYKAPEDIAYYILFVYEQLHLNPEETELVLSGKIEKTAKEHLLLYTYIRNVRFASLPNEFKYSYKFDDIPMHKFFSLFTQYYLVTN
jgi:hypothetical protein